MKQKLRETILLISGMIIGIALIIFMFNAKANVSCEAYGIELKNISPAKCYGDFDNSFCPIPNDIKCSFNGNAPIWMIAAMSS